MKNIKSLTIISILILFSFSIKTYAEINLWSLGNEIEKTDGNIVFYQTWSNAHPDFYVHDITYLSDGIFVKGWILEPKSSGPHPVLIWNRGGRGQQSDIRWHTLGGNDILYKRELFPYASSGYVVVCTQYRHNGKKVILNYDNQYIPVYPPVDSDYSSGIDPFIENTGNDLQGSVEINDIINLLPLIKKLNRPNGNGGLMIDVTIARIAMMGMSRGGMETYIAVRELSDSVKYGKLPKLQCAIVKGALSNYPGTLKDIFEGKTYHKDVYSSLVQIPRGVTAKNAGNFDLVYPDDYDDPSDSGYPFWDFFPESTFPVWDDADISSDDWPECDLIDPPTYPYGEICSEEYYYRSAPMWNSFWSQNQIPMLVLHGKGDTQVLWDDAQEIYDKMVLDGDPSLYSLILFEDSDDNSSACSFLGSDFQRILHCDHWLVNYNYGRDEVFSWLEKYLGNINLDIKPSSYPNSINPRSKGKIPVAILSTMHFDAPTEVDTESLTFGSTGDEESLAFCSRSSEDVNDDGYDDLVCHFYTRNAEFQCGDSEGILIGKTMDETPLEGSDSVRIVPSACH